MEADENKMRKAAHLMVQNLASNLAMVTCKEPLRISMTSSLRNIFVANGFTDVCMILLMSILGVNNPTHLFCHLGYIGASHPIDGRGQFGPCLHSH
jgi:CCR4-NOT transcription complex subunit 1